MKKALKSITGVHVLGTVYTNDSKSLKSLTSAKKMISKTIKKYHFKELGASYHEFPGGGFTGIICLAESHIAIHTWPENQYLTMDVYICNHTKNNESSCEKVFDEICMFFRPLKIKKRIVKR